MGANSFKYTTLTLTQDKELLTNSAPQHPSKLSPVFRVMDTSQALKCCQAEKSL